MNTAAHFLRLASAAMLAALFSGPLMAQAVPDRYVFEDEESKGPWKEAEVQFPAPPKDADLLSFQPEANTSMRFAIDPNSLSIGPDGVVRYTVVSTTTGGARNASYEGIRCKTFERRVYGYNHKEAWTRSRNSEWKRMTRGDRNGYADALALDYFCSATSQVGTRDEIIARIRKKDILNPRVQY